MNSFYHDESVENINIAFARAALQRIVAKYVLHLHHAGRPKALMDKWIRWFGTPS
jgi:hypothetical protein